jgi:metallo-beta-lactamase family protein
MKLTFYGAAGEVTGSNFLLQIGEHNILIDCGLHQSTHFSDDKNFDPFPYDPKTIEAVFVTHAHIDHTGRLPKLVHEGFTGKIYSTPPTRDFAEPLLLDSGHVLEQEALRINRPPLYTPEDVMQALDQWEGTPYHKRLDFKDFAVTFFDAGHILGSSSVLIEAEGKRLVFSGDLGNTPAPILKPTEHIAGADYCIMESTYGGRVHEDTSERKQLFQKVIIDTIKAGGTLIIPAFAMERTQELLFELNYLIEHNLIPRVPVFIDSPLAIKLTAVYQKYESYFNRATTNIIRSGDQIFNFPGLHMSLTTEQSKDINYVTGPKIIIAGSGMSQGGRILHHEERYLPDPKSTLLIVGFQAEGSLGRRLLNHVHEVYIFNRPIIVRASVKAIGGYSAHADQPRLMSWLSSMQKTLKQVFLVHGEPVEANALAGVLKNTMHLNAEIPKAGQVYDLSS